MNFWILTIMRLRPKLEVMYKKLDRRADALALSVCGDTFKLYEEIIDINEKKTLLINIKVLFDSFLSALSAEERVIIINYAKNMPLEEIAGELNIHRSTVMRRLNKAVKKCIREAAKLNYSAKKLERDYGDSPLVINTYNLIIREHLTRSTAARSAKADAKGAAIPPAKPAESAALPAL